MDYAQMDTLDKQYINTITIANMLLNILGTLIGY